MSHHSRWVAVVVAVSGVLFTDAADAGENTIKPTNKWTGIVREAKPSNAADLTEDGVTCLTSAKEVRKLWKAWKFGDSPPSYAMTRPVKRLADDLAGSLDGSAAVVAGGPDEDTAEHRKALAGLVSEPAPAGVIRRTPMI